MPLFGARGERPVTFDLASAADVQYAASIPGVAVRGRRVQAAWDTAPLIARAANVPLETPTGFAPEDIAGYAEYAARFKSVLRPHQRAAVPHLATRSWAVLRLPCRCGKTLAALAAATLVGAQRILVLTVDSAKWGWVDEIFRWTSRSVALPKGRRGDTLLVPCRACLGTGRVGSGRCAACRLLNGQSFGYRQLAPREPPCRWHPSAGATETETCPVCANETARAFNESVVVANYDIVIAQKAQTLQGVGVRRRDMDGWADRFAKVEWDLVILDEAQAVRGRTKPEKRWESRSDRTRLSCMLAKRVWLLTATLVYTYTRDVYAPLNIASNGLVGSDDQFDLAYCDLHRDEEGYWDNDGESERARTELVERLKHVMHSKSRAECVGPESEPTVQIVRYEAEGDAHAQLLDPVDASDDVTTDDVHEEHVARALARAFALKFDGVMEQLRLELSEGAKIVVFGHHRADLLRIFEALVQGQRRDNKHLREARYWYVTSQSLRTSDGAVSGDRSKAKRDLAAEFRAWPKAGAFIATSASMEAGISLLGASSVHYVELEWSPSLLVQSKERPNEIGYPPATVVIHELQDSIDLRIRERLGHRFWVSGTIGDDAAALDMHHAVKRKKDFAREIWERHNAALSQVHRG